MTLTGAVCGSVNVRSTGRCSTRPTVSPGLYTEHIGGRGLVELIGSVRIPISTRHDKLRGKYTTCAIFVVASGH